MAIYKLIEDFYEHSYTLIAIHCSLEDYKMAYFLNSFINTKFSRLSFDLKLSTNASFSIYEWEDKINETTWNLLSNNSGIDLEETTGVLFTKDQSMISNYLIPEHKKVDYFLKIDNGNIFEKTKIIIKKINEIPQVITAYAVEPDQLKSKNNLIFLSNA
jgi:hypothetical protein